jgi:RecB family exonuclease
MSERIITEIDAARSPFVGEAYARRLLAFVRDLTRYASEGNESDARRALASPYSGVPNVDARALCVAAGERRAVAETIAADRVPLPHEVTVAARRFTRLLADVRDAYRAQGATTREHLKTIELGLAAALELDAEERVTFEALVGIAGALDAARAAGAPWEARELLTALERLVPAVAVSESAQPSSQARFPQEPQGSQEPEATSTPRVANVLRAHPPETPWVVKRRRGHFSASSLGAFAECERRWYYRYVCAAVEDRGSSASFYGTAFHWALERFHQEFARADAAPLELLERKLDSYLATSFERFRSGFETTVEYELQRRRAKRTGRRYVSWFVERARAHPFTVIGTEEAVNLELDGYTFIGYIDRLDRDDATAAVTVVDYKTGSIAESAQEYRAKVAEFLDFQLPFYYWARTAAGDRVTRLSLVPLKDSARDVRPIELEVVPVAAPRSYGDSATGTIGIVELERARAKMIELAALLADGPLVRFPATDDPDACRYCAYKLACRERPLPREDRFGR